MDKISERRSHQRTGRIVVLICIRNIQIHRNLNIFDRADKLLLDMGQ